MAVYDRRYKPYQGEITEPRWRFLTIPRFAFREVFSSRLFLSFYVLCFGATVVGSVLIYLHHNLDALKIIGLGSAADLLKIGPGFFGFLTTWHSIQLYVMVLYVGPTLISDDLSDNALPLYLSRPFSRLEYLLGKFSVLAILGSAISWIPLGWLFLFQSSLEGGRWALDHAYLLVGLILWPMVWILITGLMALAFSAWLRWRPVATGMLVAAYLVPWGFGEMINGLFGTSIGDLIALPKLISSVIGDLFYGKSPSDLPMVLCWAALVAIALACLAILHRRVKAYEVIR